MFNVEQTEGCELKDWATVEPPDPIEAAEEIIRNMPHPPRIANFAASSRDFPHYSPDFDHIMIPHKHQYNRIERYYATMFHEMIHSTGHDKRLGRLKQEKYEGGNIHTRGKEEMVAGMGQAILAGTAGIAQANELHDAAYVREWRDIIAADKKMVLYAAAQAQKAADFILGNA